MALPDAAGNVADTVARALGVGVTGASRCFGGDINQAWRIELADGRSAFCKSRTGAPAGEFANEAAGLEWLAGAGGLSVPEVLAVVEPGGEGGPRGLVLEWVEPSGPAVNEEALGCGLATIHRAGADRHGLPAPGAAGAEVRFGHAVMPAPDPGEGGFAEVYAGRIEALTAQALELGAIGRGDAVVLTALASRMESFAGPDEPPARLHGDLWSGNVMAGPGGEPWLIDPAAYGGHREVDLAMLELFGSPGAGFYAAYEEVSPLDSERTERIALWQVQPLLVHAILFGGRYGAAAVTAARRYVR
jgi:fructosamine-3-kinase